MKIFHCDHCDHLLFFENHACVSCGRRLAFLPDIFDMGSLDAVGNATTPIVIEAVASGE